MRPAGVGATSRWYTGRAAWPLLALSLLWLTGCTQGSNIADLQEFVSEVKSHKGRITPLPEFEPVQGFSYAADNLKDPFVTWETDVVPVEQVKTSINGIMPDVSRKKEPLESYPLDTLRMVGVVTIRGETWALVKASDGVVYRVRRGQYLGQNNGRVVRVEEERLVLTEIIPNGIGGWEEREASLAMAESQ